MAKSATGVFRILANSLVRRIIGGIGIVCCPLPISGMGLRIGMTNRVGAVPQGLVEYGGVGNEAAVEDVLWPAVAISTIKLVNLCRRSVIGSVHMRQNMRGRRLPSPRVTAGYFKTARPCESTAKVPPMAGRGGAGGPAEGLGKELMIYQHVGPARRVDTKGWPFKVAVETAHCIAVSGKVYSVANPAAIYIRGRL
jgi:hypothetical protein